jgi:hypothetical protein
MTNYGNHFVLICIILVLFSRSLIGQDFYHAGGAMLMSREEYSKLPKATSEDIAKTRNPNAVYSLLTSTSKILLSPPIGNQGTQNSCVAWASSEALGVLAYPKYSCWSVAQRSASYIYNQLNGGSCSTILYLMDGVNLITNQGSCSKNLMPYNPNSCTTQPNPNQTLEASYNRLNSHLILNTNDVTNIKLSIDNGNPVLIAFPLNTSFNDMWNSGGVWSQSYGGYTTGHVTCLIGYDDNTQRFKVMNSWGTNGGDAGYFWITYNLVLNNVLWEVVQVSNISQGHSMYVSGPTPNLVCSGGTTFSLNHPPAGCTINWNKSSNLSLVNNYGETAVFTSVPGAGSSAWVKVSVSGCSFDISTYPTWAGVFNNTVVTGQAAVCPNSLYTYTAQVPFGHQPGYSYSWTYPSGWYNNGQMQNNILLKTPMYNMSYGTVRVSITNNCGISGYSGITVYPKPGCGGYFMLYPNPASDEVNIKVNEISTSTDDTTTVSISSTNIIPKYTIKVFNNQGKLMLSFARTGKTFTIPLVNLQEGNYTVELNDGKYTDSNQLIIKHN